jgi:alkanesulfonate monooxygenase SsuD/methylene tetrahydromethanopterin reductase-like flavin-dependent oxidoreductase (luciferase family)
MTSHRPKVGIILPMFSGDPAKVLDAARSAEALGFDGVFAFDHFFPPGGSPDKPALEAFTTLAAVAQATERVAMGTLVTRAVLRPPGLLAKLTATLDQISGGRMILGIGTGDPIDLPEHHAFGFPDLKPKERRAHLQETVSALKALFQGKVYAGGEHIPRIEGPLIPAPNHPGGPPIWLGALSDEVVKIAAHLADGWNGWGLEPDAFAKKAKLLADESDKAGRKAEATWAGIVLVGENEAEAELFAESRRRKNMIDAVSWMGGVDRFAEHIHALAAAGATWVVMVLAGPAGRRELLSERVLPGL